MCLIWLLTWITFNTNNAYFSEVVLEQGVIMTPLVLISDQISNNTGKYRLKTKTHVMDIFSQAEERNDKYIMRKEDGS
jgi:hypothetical protein